MKIPRRSVVLTAALSSILLQTTPVLADKATDIRASVKAARDSQIEMNNFLRRYSVEIVREETGKIDGQVNGTLNGDGQMFHLGNVGALAAGLAGFATEAPLLFNPFSAIAGGAGLGLAPITSLLSGLGGWGYGSLGISGELHGEIHGTQTKINDSAHLFLVITKDQTFFDQADNLYRWAKSGKDPYTWENSKPLEELATIQRTPHIVTTAVAQDFRQRRDQFANSVQNADRLISASLGEAIYHDARTEIDEMKAWAADKRVVFTQVAPNNMVSVSANGFNHACPHFTHDEDQSLDRNYLRIVKTGINPSPDGNPQPRIQSTDCRDFDDTLDWQAELRKELDAYVWVDAWKGHPKTSFFVSALAGAYQKVDVAKYFRVDATIRRAKIEVSNGLACNPGDQGGTCKSEESIWRTLFDEKNMEKKEERLFF